MAWETKISESRRKCQSTFRRRLLRWKEVTPASYRPTTLHPHVTKLSERLLLQRLNPQLVTGVLYHHTQAENMERHPVAVFLDIEKAYNWVWHEGLIHKMMRTTTLLALVCILASFRFS